MRKRLKFLVEKKFNRIDFITICAFGVAFGDGYGWHGLGVLVVGLLLSSAVELYVNGEIL